MKRLFLISFILLGFLSTDCSAVPARQIQAGSTEASVATPLMGYYGRPKSWEGKRNYLGTLTDTSNAIKEFFGWENLDKETCRKNAILSSVGLVGVLLFLLICFLIVGPDRLLDEQEGKKSTGLLVFIAFSVVVLSAALLVQNVMAVQYLVAEERGFDFMVFGETPFWEFVGEFIAIAAVMALVFLYNMGLVAVSGLFGFTRNSQSHMKDALYGLILPIAAFLFMMLASLIDFIHINLLPFSFKVLRLGCILLPVLGLIFSIVHKGRAWVVLPLGIINAISLACLGVIISFFLPTVALLAVLAALASLIIPFFVGGLGMGGGPAFAVGGADEGSKNENPNDFSMNNMEKTQQTDGDGNDVFKRKSDGKRFIHTATGFRELDD